MLGRQYRESFRFLTRIWLGLVPVVILSGIGLFTISGCQDNVSAISSIPVASPIPTEVEKAIPPPIIVTVSAPQGRESFSPMDPVDLAATAAILTEATEPNDDIDSDGTTKLVDTPVATPLPTFTPPELPQTSPFEHFWLQRPVPDGSTVWTDKAYPYGSTRGGTLRPHHGVEFNVPQGTPILAAASGIVIVAGDDRDTTLGATPDFYGNVIVIQHDTGWDNQNVYSVYGHLSQIMVSVDQHVQAQDVIALSGASGVADGPHLHFEVRLGENSYDATRNPLLWLYPFPDRGVVAGRIITQDGRLVGENPVSLRRIDAPSPYSATTTYASDSVNPDDKWQENFVLDDVVAGYYELLVGTGEDKQRIELWVYPYQASFVEITLGD